MVYHPPFCVKNKLVQILGPHAVIDFSSIEATTKSPTGEFEPKSVTQTQKSMLTPANEIILSLLETLSRLSDTT